VGRRGVAGDGIGFSDGDQPDELGMRGFEFAVDADVIAAKSTDTDDGYTNGGGSHRLFFRTGGSDGSVDGLAATSVEVEDLGDLVLDLSAGSGSEAGSSGDRLVADVGVGSDDFQQIESDVFRAASGVGRIVHGKAFQKCLTRRC
jgi:hypothetical protein